MTEKMRCAVLTSTRFHMFDLARQLKAQGHEVRLLTGYPRWRLDPDLRDIARTNSLLILPLVGLPHLGLPWPRPLKWSLEHLARRHLSSWARRHLEGVQVLEALSGWGLEAGPYVQQQGGVHLCNRGSAHILFQKEILAEEFARWGAPAPDGFPEWVLARETGEYQAADAVVVPSQFARRTFVDRGVSEEKVFVCPYGVELSLFRPFPKADRTFRVLFVGAFSIRKGIGYLFEAVRPLVPQGRVEVWLIGGPSPEAGEILARHQELFINKGFHPRKDLAPLYSQGSVLVLPSVEEGFGLVQAQALACGVPVIATHNTGAEDLFTDGVEGFIVPPRDPLAIREKLEWLLDHPLEHEKMRAAALQRVRELGGWEQYGKICESTYWKVLRKAQKND
ncbi:MAG: glycosyltransferase family 4 protein [Deltaproteobacteria bacterium]|nr:glycosyltransferase family 4 protein [Deltaproteobacteria bacterium]MBM4286861.1 glycosyltransferase family 4 protein [Deltaproteobacteria bacterium]